MILFGLRKIIRLAKPIFHQVTDAPGVFFFYNKLNSMSNDVGPANSCHNNGSLGSHRLLSKKMTIKLKRIEK